MISWVNGRLKAARNKGHLKDSGKNSLDAKGVASKFAGRGAIKEAFTGAMLDLERAIYLSSSLFYEKQALKKIKKLKKLMKEKKI